jgi:CheY-like chemotaxis protein
MRVESDRSCSSQPRRSVRVLVVDDEQLGTLVRVAVLISLGFDAVVSHSGPEALARADLASFDVIVLDYDMPVMNGAETARCLKQLGVRAGLVLLSGRIDAPPEAGLFNVFVSKGQGVPSLMAAIKIALETGLQPIRVSPSTQL